MKWKFVLVGIGVAIAAIAIARNIQSKMAASAIANDYEFCSRSYKLLGAIDRIKTLPDDDPSKRLALEHSSKVEASCSRYHKYFNEWADSEIKPSGDLIFALLLRYEPEKAKSLGWNSSKEKP